MVSKYILCKNGNKKSLRQHRISTEVCRICGKSEKCDSYKKYLKETTETANK